MAIIKDIYDSNDRSSRTDSYRFTVENLDDPLYTSLVSLNKKQNKVWRINCIEHRHINKYCYPHKVVSMPRGPRVSSVIKRYGKAFVEQNPFRRRMFDQNLPKEYATSFDVYVQKDHYQWHRMEDWIKSKIKDRKTYLKIQSLKDKISELEYYDQVLAPSSNSF